MVDFHKLTFNYQKDSAVTRKAGCTSGRTKKKKNRVWGIKGWIALSATRSDTHEVQDTAAARTQKYKAPR